MKYVSNTDWPAVARRIRASPRIALCTHERPDGDALGSVLALERALRTFGREVDVLLVGPIEPALVPLIAPSRVHVVDEAPPRDGYDLVLIVDTGAWTQLGTLRPWLASMYDRAIGIDHHRTGDDSAAHRVVDPDAAATTQLVLSLLDELGFDLEADARRAHDTENAWPGAGSVAEALFVGLATDTGWFRFSNGDARAFADASRLLATGIDKPSLYRQIEETFEPARLAIQARALASVELLRDGAVAIQSLSQQDLRDAGADAEMLTNLVNGPMAVASVRVSIMLVEVDGNATKMSFRAKPSTVEDDLSNVSDLAGRFGGGGHAFAAGARAATGLEETRAKLVAALERGASVSRGRV